MTSRYSRAIEAYLEQTQHANMIEAKEKRHRRCSNASVIADADKRSNVAANAIAHQCVQLCMQPVYVRSVSTTPIGTCPSNITFSLFSRAFFSSDSTKLLSSTLVTLPKDTQKSIGSPHMLFNAMARRPGITSVLQTRLV